VKIFRDETAELRAKQALEKSREELEAALRETERARAEAEAAGRAKDNFFAVLSHELRTPLMPVLTVTRTLARRKDLPPAVADGLEMIQRNVQIEAQFIDELLDLTRIERGKMELVCEPMDLHEAVRRAVEVSKPDIKAKKQRLSVALEATQHEVNGDFTRLQQVFWNLLKNAAKFTPNEGKISIRTRNEADRIVIEISDTGMGIESESLPKIFDAFVQGNESVAREFGGLGLGLALAKATINGHGGTVRAASDGADKGATFTVELPLLGLA
jgi:signal transduction histidine kinase